MVQTSVDLPILHFAPFRRYAKKADYFAPQYSCHPRIKNQKLTQHVRFRFLFIVVISLVFVKFILFIQRLSVCQLTLKSAELSSVLQNSIYRYVYNLQDCFILAQTNKKSQNIIKKCFIQRIHAQPTYIEKRTFFILLNYFSPCVYK